MAARLGTDCAVANGAGLTVKVCNAITLASPPPIIVIPATYAGSEITPVYRIRANGLKCTRRDAGVLPRTVIYALRLSRALPASMSLVSCIGGIAHAV